MDRIGGERGEGRSVEDRADQVSSGDEFGKKGRDCTMVSAYCLFACRYDT